MRPLRVGDDIIPVSEFKSRAADHLRRIADSGQPLVITQNGKPAGVLLSPASFDELTERKRFVAAVEEGLADADAGRLHPHAQVAAEMRARYRKPRRR